MLARVEILDIHSEGELHRTENFLNLLQRFPAEVLSLEHFALGLLHQFTNEPNIRVRKAISRTYAELKLIDAPVQVVVNRFFLRRFLLLWPGV